MKLTPTLDTNAMRFTAQYAAHLEKFLPFYLHVLTNLIPTPGTIQANHFFSFLLQLSPHRHPLE